MTWSVLILLASLSPAASEPAKLVEALASSDRVEREEAAGALEELGRSALPALYEARKTSTAEARPRIAHVIDLIERQRLLRGTRIAIDFEDRPLSEVVAALAARSGYSVALGPEVASRERKITLRVDEPVAFWQALDRLDDLAAVRQSPAVRRSADGREPAIVLTTAEGPRSPADYVGPFRVELLRIGRQRELTPARAPTEPRVRDELALDLQLVAEPGLILNLNGPPVVKQANDDLDHDMRLAVSGGSSRGPRRATALVEKETPSVCQYRIDLKPPEEPGRRIKILAGYLPITVFARCGDPLVVALADAQGKTFTAEDDALTVVELERQNSTTKIRLRLPAGEPYRPTSSPAPAQLPLGDYRASFRLEDHLQFLDKQGQTCLWARTYAPRPGADGAEITLDVLDGRAGPAKELRYFNLIGTSTEVVFEFNDLPLP